MNKDLQAIMARRRQLADNKGGEKGEDDGKGKKDHEAEAHVHATTTSGMDLQEIMARRRRLADGEEIEGGDSYADLHASKNSNFSHASGGSGIMDFLSGSQGSVQQNSPLQPAKPRAAAQPRTWSDTSGGSPAFQGSPSAVSSPVKASLKKFEMSKDLQAILKKRRQAAGGGDDDDDDNDEEEEEDDEEEESELEPRKPSPPTEKEKQKGQSEQQVKGQSMISATFKEEEQPASPSKKKKGVNTKGNTRQRSHEENSSSEEELSIDELSIDEESSSSLEEECKVMEEEEDIEPAPPVPARAPPLSPPEPSRKIKHPKKQKSTKSLTGDAGGGDQKRASRKEMSTSTHSLKQRQQRKEEEEEDDTHSSSHVSVSGASPRTPHAHKQSHTASTSARGARQRQLRKNTSSNKMMDSDDTSVAHSVDQSIGSSKESSKSGDNQSVNTSPRKAPRQHRRASTSGGTSGTDSSGDNKSNSLRALHVANRRQSTGVSRGADSDDYSRAGESVAESVASERSGPRRVAKRSGRRKPPSSGASVDSNVSDTRRTSSRDSKDDNDNKESGEQKEHRRSKRPGGRRRGESPTTSQYGSASSDEGTKPPPKPRRDNKPAESEIRKEVGDKQPSGGFGDFAGFPTSSASAATEPQPAKSGFGDFDDANFSSFPASGLTAFASSSKSGFADFEDTGFPAQPATTTAPSITPAMSGFSADFGADGFDAFGSDAQPFPSQPQQTLFDAPKETSWDTSPLVDMPTAPKSKLSLLSKTTFTTAFWGTPVTNPLNGNILFCSAGRGGAILHEVDPHREYVQVSSAPVLSTELQRRLATKYNVSASSVETVITLTTGLHHAHGQARTRVAAILDLKVLESHQLMRIVAVWQWGYASPHPNALQFAMTPPSGGEFSYDSSSLQVADSLMFIAGSSPKGPCVFMCKPTVRETWSANFLSGSGRVTSMSVTPHAKREHPYLAVGLSDRSVSVWTYKGALSGTAAKGNEPSKRWLFPLCRLDAATNLVEAEPSSFGTTPSGPDSKVAGHCTQLAWLPPQSSTSSLLMLAASFQNGIAIFHVGLPVVADRAKGDFRPLPEPTQSTLLAQTPSLSPVAVKRWLGGHERSYISWMTLGAHANPCIAMLLHSDDESGGFARIVICGLQLPLYRRDPWPKERLIPLDLFASTTVAKKSNSFPMGLLQNSGLRSVLCFSQRSVMALSPVRSTVQPDPVVSQLGHPIASEPPGLTSTGEPLLPDADSDTDGILHVFTVTQCERQKSEYNPNMQEWGRPRRRHWLCRTLVGDTKATAGQEEAKEDRGFGADDTVTGGALSDVVCELYDDALTGLSPCRIVRRKGSTLCAVMYRASLSTKSGSPKGFSLDATKIAFIDYSGSAASIDVVPGRDVAFFPSEGQDTPCGVILSADGSSLTSFAWEPSKRSCKLGAAFRPIVGVDTDANYVECRRVFAFSGASMVGLVVVGTRHQDGRSSLLSGDLCAVTDLSLNKWSMLLPNIVSGLSLFLDEEEEVFSVAGLEGDDSGYRNFAVATSSRVLIVSSGMEVVSSVQADVSCSALSAIGAFAVAFCSGGKVRYLCCLDGSLASGTIATLPLPMSGHVERLLTAVRPDRILITEANGGDRLVEYGQNPGIFLLPTAVTRPVLLLEAMVANAICVGGKQDSSTPTLRTVIEKFGRKVASITHGDDEGVGNIGAGITPRTFEMLQKYGLHQAASWLLTGAVSFDRSANTRILPPWLPIASKAKGALNCDAFLHVVANGDEYLSEYVKSPDGMAAALPRPSVPAAYICRENALQSLGNGKALDAMKMLDFVGSEATESLILELALSLEKGSSRDLSGILKSMCGYNDTGLSRSSAPVKAPASLAALAVTMKENKGRGGPLEMKEDEIGRWMKPLAPSLQRGARIMRSRQKIFGLAELSIAGDRNEDKSDEVWVSPCNESKHVWNEGPRKQRNHLLMLDSIEDWLGRQRPVILGKEGASAAGDRGQKALADILNMDDDDSFGGKSDLESVQDGWVDGVGEGRSDEANLSAYYRMSEGEDEDSPWRSEGIVDLSPFQNKAVVVGDTESFHLQPTTSSVDIGEAGKVKQLYDIVFEKSGDGISSGLAIPAYRGGSLDVGVLHRPEKTTRHKCSIEFWFYLPPSENVPSDLVLARRTMGPSGDNLSKVCLASDKGSVLWEVVLRRTGELEFRSCGGSTLRSSQNYDPVAAAAAAAAAAENDSDDEIERSDLAKFGRWNHLCLVLKSRGDQGVSKCSVAIILKGEEVASTDLSLQPPGFDEDDLDSITTLDKIMQKSYMVFGLNHGAGFRLTELRVWACERSADDTKSMLYEYLNVAEAKKKFKVKISNKNKFGGSKLGKGLAPSKGMIGAPKVVLGSAQPKKGGVLSLAPTKKGEQKFSLAPKGRNEEQVEEPQVQPTAAAEPAAGFEASFESFGGFGQQPAQREAAAKAAEEQLGEDAEYEEGEEEDDDGAPTSLWDTAIPLSQQVRSSAAAAVIRGPPATRHFGGNRGGLPDFSGMERFGVGGIAICGSEKTIVWRDNEDPPALTYPIGASGAIVSDLMDDEGSEFLCCFLAKEKRMVVFELQSRTVVVELQMTTKLNFWRFLPPEAAENTLCFMLVTPVGGFHWMALEESPRPHQVWKRGAELQGKKVVSYEEGGSNGLEGPDITSRVGLVMVTQASGGGALEAWIIPIDGDSQACQVSDDVMGACLCQPPFVEDGPFLPLLVTVHQLEEGIYVNVLSVTEPKKGSVQLGEIEVTRVIEETGFEDLDFEPPVMAMGSFPEAICCSLGNIFVVIVRRKGLIAAFELEEDDLSLIALESVGHYVVDAVMRYSAEVGGAEIAMLLSDNDNPKDGRMVSFCFRSAA